MELYLQFGYGMMEHCRHLFNRWYGGTVILSPRDLAPTRINSFSANIRSINGSRIMIDPQFYLPHADHHRLCSHSYWPEDYETNNFWRGPALDSLLENLLALNQGTQASAIIAPGMLAATVDGDWLAVHREVNSRIRQIQNDPTPLYATISLAAECLAHQDQIELLLEETESWNVDGYYLVCEHPDGNYLVDQPLWLANLLDLAAGLRLQNREVILGYCSHQMLIGSCANITAICSGTWLNVRSFPPEKFRQQVEEDRRTRSRWYYCPEALSEYKVDFLDIAFREGILPEMEPPTEMASTYLSALFQGDQPTTIGIDEPKAFRHYLHCLKNQVDHARDTNFEAACAKHEELLDRAETKLDLLRRRGVLGNKREFYDCINANRSALQVLKANRGPMLRRNWHL